MLSKLITQERRGCRGRRGGAGVLAALPLYHLVWWVLRLWHSNRQCDDSNTGQGEGVAWELVDESTASVVDDITAHTTVRCWCPSDLLSLQKLCKGLRNSYRVYGNLFASLLDTYGIADCEREADIHSQHLDVSVSSSDVSVNSSDVPVSSSDAATNVKEVETAADATVVEEAKSFLSS
uniref:Uncharacterized protein n=2 Tax=Lygus hesperus TaxID=30085 RepID=A0A146LNR8_LYGHE